MRIAQLNMNHCETAHNLLSQMIREKKLDLVLISEPYKNLTTSTWITDISKKTAIWTCSSMAFQEVNTNFNGFVRAKVNGIHFYSCYAPPSWTQNEYQNMLDELAQDALNKGKFVIGGDFNAWAVEWGSRTTGPRGFSLLETFAALNLTLLNDGMDNTYRKAGTGSIIDITLTSACLARFTKWRLCEDYTGSDHQAIILDIFSLNKCGTQRKKLTGPKWKVEMLDQEVFRETLIPYQVEAGTAENQAK